MPRLCEFYGIVIAMFWREGGHQTPHFHAAHAGKVASVGFDGRVIAGDLTRRGLALVRHWAAEHQSELVANWRRVEAGQPLEPIDPLP
jgi:hypothetical protein